MSTHSPRPGPTELPDGMRIAVVASRWNGPIVERLLEGCTRRLQELGARLEVYRVPGAFELPTAAKWLAEDDANAAVICLGCVIRGETPHFEYVAGECARGVMRVSLDTGMPVIFGVLTVETEQQAIARTGEGHGHAGVAAADAAAEMIALRATIRGA
jgi:6,7-dimethyl-8-ribityllumazine synthase